MKARDVVETDLKYIHDSLNDEFTSMAGKNLLITGGAGFLGFYLVQSILHWNRSRNSSDAIKITVYDSYLRGVPGWLAEVRNDKNLTLVKHDIAHALPQDMDDFNYIMHAASIASPTYYRMYPIKTMDANVTGLRFLLEYCLRQKQADKPVEACLFFSSSEIYGDPLPENIPTPEDYCGNVSCLGPRACYDESKRYGETLCANFSRKYNLSIKIARPFNNYGPGLSIEDRRVIPDFARDVLSGKDIILLSDGSPTRTFCYVSDAVIGYYKLLINGRKGEAYNIGTEGPELSILDVANKVMSIARKLFAYKGRVVRGESPDKDYLVNTPNRRCPVITKAMTDLKYNPGVSLDEGLRRSLIWYGENHEEIGS